MEKFDQWQRSELCHIYVERFCKDFQPHFEHVVLHPPAPRGEGEGGRGEGEGEEGVKRVSCYARWQAGRQQAVGDLMASNFYDYLHCRNIINTSGWAGPRGPGSPVIL